MNLLPVDPAVVSLLVDSSMVSSPWKYPNKEILFVSSLLHVFFTLTFLSCLILFEHPPSIKRLVKANAPLL